MSTIVARRYAQALIERAASASLTDAVDRDVDVVRSAAEESRDLLLFFQSPVISRDRKKKVVQALFGEHVEALTVDFIELLIDKRRDSVLMDVLSAYRTLRDDAQGIAQARVRSARPLSDSDEDALRARLEKLTGLKLRLEVEVQETLLGGVVVRIGDTVYDGSVSGQLASLKERLTSGSALLN